MANEPNIAEDSGVKMSAFEVTSSTENLMLVSLQQTAPETIENVLLEVSEGEMTLELEDDTVISLNVLCRK